MPSLIRKVLLLKFHLNAQLIKLNYLHLYTKKNLPPSLRARPHPLTRNPPETPPPNFTHHPSYRPPSSLDRTGKEPFHSPLPFNFSFTYTEFNPNKPPIRLCEPKYSPFGPGFLDRVWTGLSALAVNPEEGNVVSEEVLEERRKRMRRKIQGKPLTDAEKLYFVKSCQKEKTRQQVNLGRDGLTHNMLNDIQNNFKSAEAIRMNCMGVSTVDMKNICYQLEDKTFGKIIFRDRGRLVLYRGRYYIPRKMPEVPLMLWKPNDPLYPNLIKTRINGLSFRETRKMKKKGLAVPVLTKLGKNDYYGNLVRMVREAFLFDELVRIDCKGLHIRDYKQIGRHLRDLVPCILVTFHAEQIVVWRGKDYKPREGGIFLTDWETLDNPDNDIFS